MSYRRRRSKSKNDAFDMGAILKFAGGLAVLIAIGAAYLVLSARQDAINPESFCHKAGPNRVLLVVLDASDTIDEVQAERVKSDIRATALNSPLGTRVDLYLADVADGELGRPLFSKCNPGKPGQYDALYSDVSSRQEQFEEGFLAAVEDSLTQLLTRPPANSSPILESVRSAATSAFSRLSPETSTEILIVSDMVQNSDLLRHRGTPPEFSEFREGPTWARAIADLKGSTIRIMYVMRPQYQSVQGRSHMLWWERYFEAVNGRLTKVDSI